MFVTHDQDEALAHGDRIAVMNQGRIEQVDAARGALRAAAHALRRRLPRRARTCCAATGRRGRGRARSRRAPRAGSCSRRTTTAATGRRRAVWIGLRAERISLGRARGEPASRRRSTTRSSSATGPSGASAVGDDGAERRRRQRRSRATATRGDARARSRSRREPCCGSRTGTPGVSATAARRPRACSLPAAAAPGRALLPAAGCSCSCVSLGRRSAYGGVVYELDARELRARARARCTCAILWRSLGARGLSPPLACLAARLSRSPTGSRARVPPRWRSALLVLVDPAVLDELPGADVRVDRAAAPRGARQPGARRASACRGVELLYNDVAVLLGQVYGELPFMILPLYVSLEKLDRALLEAAADLRRRPRADASGASSCR